MLCEYFSLPCFLLVRISDSLNQLNSTDHLSCQKRCGNIGLDIPSYSTLEKLDRNQIYASCQGELGKKDKPRDQTGEDKTCAFPIKTKYAFENNQWLDGDSNEVLHLPWKTPENTMGPFYPIMNNNLLLAYHKDPRFVWNGFRYLQFDSTQCQKANGYFELAKMEMTFSERHHHDEVLSVVKKDNFCRELSFNCVDLGTNEVSGPWNKTFIVKAREKCKSMGMSIKTFDLDDDNLEKTTIWTGSIRYNQYVIFRIFILYKTF